MAKRDPKRPYEQMGVVFNNQSGEEDQADCPFCGKERKFHFNPRKEQWICSSSPAVCGRAGNTTSFLTQWHEFCLDETDQAAYQSLSDDRDALPAEAFRYWGVALNPLTDEWLIPSYNAQGKLQDLRRYKPGRGLQGVAGCPNNLWGAQVLADPDRVSWPVDIAEGEWDGIALSWLNRKTGRKAVVVAVPGARVMKEEWVAMFKGRNVTWYYDHDADGETYSYKGFKKLLGIAKTQQFVQWPERLADKYDVRDFICDNALNGQAKTAMKKLRNLIVPEHWLAREEEAAAEPEKIVRPEKNITLKQVLAVFRRELVMSHDMEDAFKVLSAVVLGNQLPDDPLWLYLVGAPSCGKTELLMSVQKVPDISYHSSVSAKSMLSGYKTPGNMDPSLIPKLIGKVAVFKDWTEILSSHENEINQLSGLMRGAYDGHIKRAWGNGVTHEYHGTFNVLAGVTPMINSYNDSLMGERFLKFQLRPMTQGQQQHLIAKVMSLGSDANRNNRLQDAVCEFLSRDVKGPYPPLEDWVADRINSMSRLVAQLRQRVPWKREGLDKYLEYEPTAEVGLRLAKQFMKLGQALAIVEGTPTVGRKAYRLVHRVAMDTAVGWPQKVLSTLLVSGPSTAEDLSKQCRMEIGALRRVLRDMEVMGIAKRRAGKGETRGRPADLWSISKISARLCEEVKFNAYDRQEAASNALARA